jgi:hypothetical protein
MTATRGRRLPLLGGLAPVVGLLVVSPIAAEYLSRYQVFNPLVLLGYLGIFIPLYGTVACSSARSPAAPGVAGRRSCCLAPPSG